MNTDSSYLAAPSGEAATVREAHLLKLLRERGIFLNFGATRVKVAETLQDFRSIVGHFASMVEEIEQNYPEVDE